MTIYLDKDFCCHLQNDGGMSPVETDFFDGKCRRFIEGYRYVPEGAQWRRADGRLFPGPMIAPAEDSRLLIACQQLYEAMEPELNELRARLQNLRDCLDGLATMPSLAQLQDFLLSIRELMEED